MKKNTAEQIHDIPVLTAGEVDSYFDTSGVVRGLIEKIPETISINGMPDNYHEHTSVNKGNTIKFASNIYRELASRKLDKEVSEFEGGMHEKAIYRHVAETLRTFCSDSEKFAEVLYRTKRSLSDCCKEILEGVGASISDIEVYRRATRFYFPNSNIRFYMEISYIGVPPTENELQKESPQSVSTTKSVKPLPAKQKKSISANEKSQVTKADITKKQEQQTDDSNYIQISLF